jgi:hypothetical protein
MERRSLKSTRRRHILGPKLTGFSHLGYKRFEKIVFVILARINQGYRDFGEEDGEDVWGGGDGVIVCVGDGPDYPVECCGGIGGGLSICGVGIAHPCRGVGSAV